MPMFVDPQATVAVTDGANTVHIKAKMDARTRALVKSSITARGGGQDFELRNLGGYELALLEHNIVRWEGPEFEGVPCTAAHIGRLDPDQPLVAEVLERIGELNAPPESPDPN